MSDVALTVEMLFQTTSKFFGFFVLDTSTLDGPDVLAEDEVWVDITEDVVAIDIDRGRQRDIDEFVPAVGDIRLRNEDRAWDPTNTDSQYFGQVEPMRAVQITGTPSGGGPAVVYHGFVLDFLQRLGGAGKTSEVTAVCADSMSLLGLADMDDIVSAFDGDLSGARITRVLDRTEVDFPSGLRDIDTGDATLGPTTLGENALQYLQRVARSEMGALYAAREGDLTFKARTTPPGDSQVTFSDDGADVGYQDAGTSFGADLLRNRITGSGTSGNERSTSDPASIEAYKGVRTLPRGQLLLQADADVDAQLDWLLSRFATPEFRFTEFVVNLNRLTAAQQQALLELELNERVTGELTPPGTGSPAQVIQAARVDGIRWSIVPGQRWDATVRVSAGTRVFGFTLDDADLGVLDEDRLSA